MPDGTISATDLGPVVKPAQTLGEADAYFEYAVLTLDEEEAIEADLALKLQPFARMQAEVKEIEAAHDLKLKELKVRRNTYLNAAYAFVSRRKQRITQKGSVKTPKVRSGRFRWNVTPSFRIKNEKLFIAEAEVSTLGDKLVKVEKKPVLRPLSSTDEAVRAILRSFKSLIPVTRRGFTFWSSRRPERFVLMVKNGQRDWAVKLPDDNSPTGEEVEEKQ